MSYLEELPAEAVAAHDLARAVPEELWVTVIDALSHLVPAGGRCLDIGIGTGAVGGRLHERGVDVLGIDCNASMVAALRERHPALPVAVGDAASLPVGSASVDLAVQACLLHLVYDWPAAVREAVRTVAPGGCVALNVGQSGLAGRTGVSRYFLDALTSRIEIPPMPGPSTATEPIELLQADGHEALPRIDVRGEAMRSVRDLIFRLERNPFGWPPGVPQWALTEAAAETTTWAREAFGDVDEARPTPVSIGFAVFRVAGGG